MFDVEIFLRGEIESRCEQVKPDLADGNRPPGFDLATQIRQVLGPMDMDIHGMHAPGWQAAGVTMANGRNIRKVGLRHRRDDLDRHAGIAGTAIDRIAITGEFTGIEMAVRIDQRQVVHGVDNLTLPTQVRIVLNPEHPLARVAVIGGGPAGLMAAEVLCRGGARVDLFDAMPSVGRKFLLAGIGGMNLTHSEPRASFLARYGQRQRDIEPLLAAFAPEALRAWAHELGIETFVGSSGRVFPVSMKAAPLLRAWLHRLRSNGVQFHVRHRWLGWNADGALRFALADGESTYRFDAVILALGGGSWARLGSDGAWVPLLRAQGAEVARLKPANCGFDIAWSTHFRERFAGQALKSVTLSFGDFQRQGECMVSQYGIEGSLIYAASAAIRDCIEADGSARILLDLAPGKPLERVIAEVAHPRGSRSLSSHLQSRAGITGVKAGLLREVLSKDDFTDLRRLAATIKALPLTLTAPRPLDEAISSAGGLTFESLDAHLMLKAMPGVFCAGEMLDWEAPTGGYLLTACFASGRMAGMGALTWLSEK